jgi:hypothetical protein
MAMPFDLNKLPTEDEAFQQQVEDVDQQLEDAGDLDVNAQHLQDTGNGNVSFSFLAFSYFIITFDGI